MTTGEALVAGAAYLQRNGIESPRLDAELILAHALGLSRIQLYTEHERPVSESERVAARTLLARRAAREPLAYVLGSWGFRRLTLATDARALVPRPETEIVVERALALIAGQDAPRVLDLGTGSGAIALALATEHAGARVSASDISRDALALAATNAATLGVELELIEADLLTGISGPFELVVSNPPYVSADELEALEPEVRDWEPRAALLDDSQTGAIAAAARGVLVAGGSLVLESHALRAGAVADTLCALGYDEVAVSRDLAGRERVVEGRWRPTQ